LSYRCSKVSHDDRQNPFSSRGIPGILFRMKNVNWFEQWALHAPHFQNGYAHVRLEEYGGPSLSFRMKPGPGFGDLSHPTTRLMLHLMPAHIHSPVIDIGCGSGVLSLAARKRGAPFVYGVDIDPDILAHAKENAMLNKLDQVFFERRLPMPTSSPLILMNMISSEQQIAWSTLPQLHDLKKTLIVSGIPLEEKKVFLAKLPPSYGSLTKEKALDGWIAFHLETNANGCIRT